MPNWMRNILMIHRFVFIVCLSTFDSYSLVHVLFIYFLILESKMKRKKSFCSRHHNTHSQTKIDWKFTQNKLGALLVLFESSRKIKTTQKSKFSEQFLNSRWLFNEVNCHWTWITCILWYKKMHRWNNWKRRTPEQNVFITILVVSSFIILIVSFDQNGF